MVGAMFFEVSFLDWITSASGSLSGLIDEASDSYIALILLNHLHDLNPIAGLDWFELQKYNGRCREDKTHGMLLTSNFAAPGFLLFDVLTQLIWCWKHKKMLIKLSFI